MLGSLASWLRLLGHDTSYQADISDDDLLVQADHQGRVLLTRDRALGERSHNAIVLHSTVLAEQIQELVARLPLHLEFDPYSARCSVCNGALEPAPASSVAPEGRPALQCRGCARLYWEGTHVQRIRAQLARWRTIAASRHEGASP